MNAISSFFKEKPVYLFTAKGIAVYIIWYFLYDLWLLPNGRLDEVLSLNIIEVAGGVLKVLGFSDVYIAFRLIGIGESPGIEIVNGCNGLSSIGLFVGFVVAYPGNNMKRIIFILTGIGIIYLVNVSRIIVLTIIQLYWNTYFDLMHDYSTTAIFYTAIFIMWVIWANYGGNEAEQSTS